MAGVKSGRNAVARLNASIASLFSELAERKAAQQPTQRRLRVPAVVLVKVTGPVYPVRDDVVRERQRVTHIHVVRFALQRFLQRPERRLRLPAQQQRHQPAI